MKEFNFLSLLRVIRSTKKKKKEEEEKKEDEEEKKEKKKKGLWAWFIDTRLGRQYSIPYSFNPNVIYFGVGNGVFFER